MELICPVCNALQAAEMQCPYCGRAMIDGGAVENYLGPYSPYMGNEDREAAEQQCVHLLYCPECGFDMRAGYSLQLM